MWSSQLISYCVRFLSLRTLGGYCYIGQGYSQAIEGIQDLIPTGLSRVWIRGTEIPLTRVQRGGAGMLRSNGPARHIFAHSLLDLYPLQMPYHPPSADRLLSVLTVEGAAQNGRVRTFSSADHPTPSCPLPKNPLGGRTSRCGREKVCAGLGPGADLKQDLVFTVLSRALCHRERANSASYRLNSRPVYLLGVEPSLPCS